MNHQTILLVDDDVDDQLIFMDALKEVAPVTECITANNGLEALVHLRTLVSTPSLIFIDLNMPLMNGIECLEKIKSDPELKEIPVIIFTTSDNPLDQKRTRDLGAEVFFTKTPDFKLLTIKLRNILQTDFKSGKDGAEGNE